METNNDDFYNEMTDSAEGDEQSYANGKKGKGGKKPDPKAVLAKAQKENAALNKNLAVTAPLAKIPAPKHGISTGAKWGIGVGSAVVIGVVIFLVWRHLHKHHK